MIEKFINRFMKPAILTAAAILTVLFSGGSAYAVDVLGGACAGNSDSVVCKNQDEGQDKEEAGGQVKAVINLILMILGIAAVIVIILAGFRYVTSQGDSGGLKQAKDAILYAVIGLIVAIMSYAIVNFVIFRLQGDSSSQGQGQAQTR